MYFPIQWFRDIAYVMSKPVLSAKDSVFLACSTIVLSSATMLIAFAIRLLRNL